MRILEEIGITKLPLQWANLDNYTESEAFKIEIYLKKCDNLTDRLIGLFCDLFNGDKSSILVYNNSWWDFTIETWNYEKELYNYEIENKSKETIDYLLMLRDSGIGDNYSGICKCNDWMKFLEIVLPCIVSMKAIYSPVFFTEKRDYFFYFHHSGSIGLYYKKENESITRIMDIANQKYIIE